MNSHISMRSNVQSEIWLFWQIFDRISFFLHKLFFLFKFHFLLTFLLSFPSLQSVDWLWLRWAFIYCVIMKHCVCLLRFFLVCLTLFRRFALRGPAPAVDLKRAPSRRSCKHNQWCIYYKIVYIMMYRIICCRKPHRTFTHTWKNTTPYLKESIARPTVEPVWEPLELC